MQSVVNIIQIGDLSVVAKGSRVMIMIIYCNILSICSMGISTMIPTGNLQTQIET